MSTRDTLGLAGSTVDRIRFDACVDAGGFGVVYRGTHLDRGEPVAVKCLTLSRLPNLGDAARSSIVARFQEETKILHHLSHGTRDIVRCLSSGQLFAPATGEPVPYMVLEWLEGRSLGADLAERRERGAAGRTLQETLDLMESAALALAYAHTQGIVHRDIKPSNLMLARTSRPEGTAGALRLKVLDFGLAKILSAPGAQKNLATADGVQLVSAAYCAPEQLSQAVGEIGPWTDLYSLALVMLEVMRGTRVVAPAARRDLSKLELALPAPIEGLLLGALSPEPRERPADVGRFWTSLRAVMRQSVPRVANAAALAATAAGVDLSEAIFKARAALAEPPATGGEREPSAVAAGPASPFTGTMLMVNAPGRALHLLDPRAGARADDPETIGPGSTAPLAPPLRSPPSALPATPPSPNAVTANLVLPPSPLATSVGPGAATPLAPPRMPTPFAQPALPTPPARPASAQPARASSAPPARPSSTPPSPPPPSLTPPSLTPAGLPGAARGPGLVVALLVLLVLAIAGVAAFLLLRPHG